MWNYIAKNDRDAICLHDCQVTGMHVDGNDLVFDFSDGFWIVRNSRYKPHENTLRTDAAQMRFVDFEIENLYVYKVVRLFGKRLFVRRIEMDWQTLADRINSGAWEFEIADEYARDRRLLLGGYLWCKRKDTPEAQLAVYCTALEYRWNRICEDRVW